MIIYHQNNIGGFAGNHTIYWVGQFSTQRVAIQTAAPSLLFAGWFINLFRRRRR